MKKLGHYWDAPKIKFLRKKLSISQSRLAELLDMTQQHISKWETGYHRPGQRNQDKLTYLARTADISMLIESHEMKNLKESGQDLIMELRKNWLQDPPEISRSRRTLSIKVSRLEECIKDVDWEEFVYEL